jgi:hypothetical protein
MSSATSSFVGGGVAGFVVGGCRLKEVELTRDGSGKYASQLFANVFAIMKIITIQSPAETRMHS